MSAHLDMMNGIFDSLHSLSIAMSTEDFGPSHKKCMEDIGGASMDVVAAASALLIKAAEFAGDGDISDGEKKELGDLKDNAAAKVKTLATKFHATRKNFGKGIRHGCTI